MSAPINRGSDPASERVYSLIFNGLTAGVNQFMPLSERERVTEVIYDTLRRGGVEVRFGDGPARAEPEPAESWIVRTTFPNGVAHVFDAAGLLHQELAHQHAALTARQYGVRAEVIRRRSTDEVIATYPKQEPK